MRYITGMQALNLPCQLKTTGDWHCSSIHWEKLTERDSEESVFGTYGLEKDKRVPKHPGRHLVANHIRACLDLIETGNFSQAQGMCHDYIDNAAYDEEIFNKVDMLRLSPNWRNIDAFMTKEFKCRWLNRRQAHGGSHGN